MVAPINLYQMAAVATQNKLALPNQVANSIEGNQGLFNNIFIKKSTPKAVSVTESLQKIRQHGAYSTTDRLFMNQQIATGSYGPDQGGIKNQYFFRYKDGSSPNHRIYYGSQEYNYCLKNRIPLQKVGTDEYMKLRQTVQNRYGLTSTETSNLLTSIDNNGGVCSYSATVGDFCEVFWDPGNGTPHRLFKFPITETKNGIQVYKTNELLVDLYYETNKANGTLQYIRDMNTNVKLANGQIYYSWRDGFNTKELNNYFTQKTGDKTPMVETRFINHTNKNILRKTKKPFRRKNR